MANLRVNSIKNIDGNSGPIIDGNIDFNGTDYIVLPKGTTAERPANPALGSIRFNTTTKLIEQYVGITTDSLDVGIGNTWVSLDAYSAGRGLIAGGANTAATNFIQAISIPSTGDSQYFGNLTIDNTNVQSCGSATRSIVAGGSGSDSNRSQSIEYINIMTFGNAVEFGFSTTYIRSQCGCFSSNIRGYIAGGYSSVPGPFTVNTDSVDFFQIATEGNAVQISRLKESSPAQGAFASPTRGVIPLMVAPDGSGGIPTNSLNTITISSAGNTCDDFGDLTTAVGDKAGCSSSTRGIFIGGVTDYVPYTFTSTIQFITIASSGNSQSFGNLSLSKAIATACSSSTRGVFAGGYTVGPAPLNLNTYYNGIDFITLQSGGSAQSFGILLDTNSWGAGISDSHGGLA